MIKALFFTIIHSPVREAGSIAFFYFPDDHLRALYIQVGILLAGKAGIRQIFRRSAGTNGDIGFFFPHFLAQFRIGFCNGILQILRHFFVHNGLTQLRADFP